MSVNSSASYSNSLLLSSINSSSPYWLDCFFYHRSSLIFTIFTTTNIFLLLPLCILVLYHGLRRWWKHCSFSTAATSSHSDSFTYHIVTMEVITISGTILCCCGMYTNGFQTLEVGFYFTNCTWYGKMFFHTLTCVEHYLAAIHPITYLSLRKERWIRIRNIIFVFIWLFCFGLTSVMASETLLYLDFYLLMSSFIIISFCSLSVLYVLIRTGPKKQGRVHQSKQRAFCTVVVILGVLLLRCSSNVIWGVTYVFNGDINACVWNMYEVWLNIPSSLVLPLLFLQRSGTLACCNNNLK